MAEIQSVFDMYKMIKTLRWYGPSDQLSLEDLKQAGIEGIVTSLHQIPVGDVWTKQAILERKSLIERHGLQWSVIESLPVHEDIKKRSGNYQEFIENYKTSLKNIAACGISVVVYNFMPVLDWVRTDHYFKEKSGAMVLRYDPISFAYFDLFLLQRDQAQQDYSPELIAKAKELGQTLSLAEKQRLFKSVLLGLPGSTEDFTAEKIKELLSGYSNMSSQRLRENLIRFLKDVAPVADKSGVQLTIHPDDPPFSVLGLPRVVNTQKDLEYIFNQVDTSANGLCYCTGSLGANPDNDLIEIFNAFKHRIHFLHLRNVKRNGSEFVESDHLQGDVPMVQVVNKILELQNDTQRRIPMRPDHGYLHSMEQIKNYYPGYSFIGRLKGLAELAGLELGLMETFKK